MIKKFNFIKENKQIKIIISPRFTNEKSIPVFFHYEWEYQITIENKTNSMLTLNDIYWEIIDEMGKIYQEETFTFQKNKNFLHPLEKYTFCKTTKLSSTSAILQGRITMKQEGYPNSFHTKLPSTSLDSPHNKKTFH